MRPTKGNQKREMKDRRRRFIEEYLARRDATKAAVAAGYARSTASARGWQFLREPAVAAVIARHDRAQTRRLEITAEQVLKQIQRMAFSDHRKLFRRDGSLKPMHELDDDTAAALVGVESVTRAARGTTPESQLHKVKLGDKYPALTKLAQYFRLFDPPPAAVPAPDGDDDLAVRLEAARKRVEAYEAAEAKAAASKAAGGSGGIGVARLDPPLPASPPKEGRRGA